MRAPAVACANATTGDALHTAPGAADDAEMIGGRGHAQHSGGVVRCWCIKSGLFEPWWDLRYTPRYSRLSLIPRTPQLATEQHCDAVDVRHALHTTELVAG
jgi:hypothetical protein